MLERVGRNGTLYNVGGNINWYSYYGKCYAGFSEKLKLTYDSLGVLWANSSKFCLFFLPLLPLHECEPQLPLAPRTWQRITYPTHQCGLFLYKAYIAFN